MVRKIPVKDPLEILYKLKDIIKLLHDTGEHNMAINLIVVNVK